jgi:hypothetical protein
MSQSLKMNSVGWFEIYVTDMNRAKKFYETVLQKKLERLGSPAPDEMEIEMQAFPGDMDSYGANGALVKMEGFPVGQNSVLIYFSCEDCSIEESRITESGGKIEKKKMSIGEHGFITLASDTEGNMFGLHSMK